MKKIDLHIHTKKGVSDRPFEFSIDKLREYVDVSQLKCIAITNHNLFDKSQFKKIKEELDIPVFPGVEVDIENSHLLVISPDDKIDVFNSQCMILERKIVSQDSFITFEEFESIFGNYTDYILIPHYENKKPSISSSLLLRFNNHIKTGEVSNPKRWYVCQNQDEKLSPVIFSDLRIESNLKVFPNVLTFIDCEQISFSNLKLCLADKMKIHINKSKISDEFTIHGNINASNKLNLVVGKRSTGKTHLLNSVAKSYDETRVKYIHQFQIVKDADEEVFKLYIQEENELITKEYLELLNQYIAKIAHIDYAQHEKNTDDYLSTLASFAEGSELDNEYSRSAMFNEEEFTEELDQEYDTLINAVKVLLDSSKHKEIIENFIDRDRLISLLKELLKVKVNQDFKQRIRVFSNSIVSEIREVLSRNASRTQIFDADFTKLSREILQVKYFNTIMDKLLVENDVDELSLEVGRFNRLVKRRKYSNATDIKNFYRGYSGIANLVNSYYLNGKYFTYLKELQKKSTAYVTSNLLICIDYSIINERNRDVSGGERAEYLLIKEIKQANKYDLLLIDEPEASFDNEFLSDSIKALIRDISNSTTTFVTTHNNSLGADIFPDKIIFTDYDTDTESFTVYSGKYGNEKLKDKDNNEIECSEVVYKTLEAGEENYNIRSEVYENLKNRE